MYAHKEKHIDTLNPFQCIFINNKLKTLKETKIKRDMVLPNENEGLVYQYMHIQNGSNIVDLGASINIQWQLPNNGAKEEDISPTFNAGILDRQRPLILHVQVILGLI